MPNINGRIMIGDPGALAAPRALFVLCPVDPDRERQRPSRDRLAVRDGIAFLEACRAAGVSGEILAVNMAVGWWPYELDHAASMHGPHLRKELEARVVQGLPMPKAVHSTEQDGGVTHLWSFAHGVPSSGAFGCWVARLMGAAVVATNARLDPDRGCGYASYHEKWRGYAALGAFDGVRHFGPISDPRRESFVAGLLPPLIIEDLNQEGAA